MANSLVVRKGTDLAKRIRALRAAQYVRMSTDFQRHPIENQGATIAAYAQQRYLRELHLGNQRGPDPCGNGAMKAALEVDLDLGPYVFPAKFHWLKSRFQTFATKLAEISAGRSSRLP